MRDITACTTYSCPKAKECLRMYVEITTLVSYADFKCQEPRWEYFIPKEKENERLP